MSARQPRRTFARSFVLTFAAVPACMSSSSAPQQPPPPPPVATPTNPPPPENSPPPAPPAGSDATTASGADDHYAHKHVNPPPPMKDPEPAPPAQPAAAPMAKSWTVFKSGDSCSAVVVVSCPPNAMCNPPPPRPYACPDGISLEHPITIDARGDGCFVHREPAHCPPHVMCNPPPPRKVPCPS